MQNETELEVGYQWERSVFGRSSNYCGQRFRPASRQMGIKTVMLEQCNLDWNPENPKTTLGQEILACVKSYLSNGTELKLYCAIGTVLDFQHNIDGFFTLGDKILSIDLKVSNPPPSYSNGSFLFVMKDCNGLRLWRVCRSVAMILDEKTPSSLLGRLT